MNLGGKVEDYLETPMSENWEKILEERESERSEHLSKNPSQEGKCKIKTNEANY